MKRLSSIIFVLCNSLLFAECYELNQADCLYWSQYCEWNDETNLCEEIGGSSGGEEEFGPFEYSTISESQGLRNGPHYRDGVLYYPTDGNPPYKNIVITPGWGGNASSMFTWGEFFASNGFVALVIGPNDEINDSHQQRAEGLLDGKETIIQENSRESSPIYGLIDYANTSVCGYSMGGGAVQIAAMLDNSLKSAISLNPTIIIEDCDICTAYDYCICLVPEFINHSVPSLIFAGETEVNELPSYDGLLGQNIYANLPESTEKILFEGANSGHGFAAYPYGEVSEYILNWLSFQVFDDNSYCESLIGTPTSASLYETNIDCLNLLLGDVNGDSIINILDVILTVNLILDSDYNNIADINLDGLINILDVVQLVNIILT